MPTRALAETGGFPYCFVRSPSNAWTIPINAPGIPIAMGGVQGAQLDPLIEITPDSAYAVLDDSAGGTVLRIENPLPKSHYAVRLGGHCTGGSQPTEFGATVDYTAAAPFPTRIGVLKEERPGVIRLTLDESMLPYQQLAKIDLRFADNRGGAYQPGKIISRDGYGLRICKGNSCAKSESTFLPVDATVAFSPCDKAGDTVIEEEVVATASFPGTNLQPARAVGKFRIECGTSVAGNVYTTAADPGSVSGGSCSTATMHQPATFGSRMFALIVTVAPGFLHWRRRRRHG